MSCRKLFALALFGVWAHSGFAGATDAITTAVALRGQGDFKEAANVLTAALQKEKLSADERKKVELQIDLIERTRQDYTTTKEQLAKQLSGSLKNFTAKEFERWIAEGRFDSRPIDGTTYFVDTSLRNLYYRYPELEARRRQPRSEARLRRAMLENCRAIKKAAAAEKKPYVLPYRFRCAMTVTADKNAAPAGETIRAWVPIPREYPFQTDFKLLSVSPAGALLDVKTSPIRSAYFEQIAQKDQPTIFKVAYEYTMYGVHFDLRPSDIRPIDLSDPELKKFIGEAPHVVFTPKMKKLAEEVAGHETNPMLKAKAFFDWISGHIQFSLAREYSTLTNLSDYCLANGYGDCGQEAMLFITLCRAQGIPARWQSGWNFFPGAKSNHDWVEIYLAPYGWMPADPCAGIGAMRAAALTADERRELRDFYFGGLNQYRMIANSDHTQELRPPKQSMRSDDVDFQRGELEYGNTNIYLDKYNYDLTVERLSPPKAH